MRETGKRVLVLIDCQNLYHNCRIQNRQVDYARIKDLLQDEYAGAELRIRAYLVTSSSVDTQRFEDFLKKIGITFRIKRVSKHYREDEGQHLRLLRSKDANHDVNIIMDALDCMDWADRLVLVSGDGDFSDLLFKYRHEGKKTSVWSFRRSFSKVLVRSVDAVHFLDDENIYRETEKCDQPGKLKKPYEVGSTEN